MTSPASTVDLGPHRLTGKVAVVSGGGTSGAGDENGKAAAVLFARHGAAVIVSDINRDAAEATVEEIVGSGGRAVAVHGDSSDSNDCFRVVDTALRVFGRLDILVNNVGITGPSLSVVEIGIPAWEHVFAVNVTSAMLMCKHAIPAFRDGGAIVNVSSIGAVRWTERTAYAASKGALLSLTVALAGQHAHAGIRVNALLPGAVWTPAAEAEAREKAGGDSATIARIRAQRRRQAMLEVEGTAWDVAYAALYLASDEAGWVTGQCLAVDGGASIARRLDQANL